MVIVWFEVDGGEGDRDGEGLMLEDLLFCSSRISVSVRRSRIVFMW